MDQDILRIILKFCMDQVILHGSIISPLLIKILIYTKIFIAFHFSYCEI